MSTRQYAWKNEEENEMEMSVKGINKRAMGILGVNNSVDLHEMHGFYILPTGKVSHEGKLYANLLDALKGREIEKPAIASGPGAPKSGSHGVLVFIAVLLAIIVGYGALNFIAGVALVM